jgi:hypothetical protein
MTAALGLGVGRRAPASREELRRQLLALVLAAVLVWYTLVVPPHAGARSQSGLTPDDEGGDGEVRGAEPRGAEPPAEKAEPRPVEDLDWPEYIYPD